MEEISVSFYVCLACAFFWLFVGDDVGKNKEEKEQREEGGRRESRAHPGTSHLN